MVVLAIVLAVVLVNVVMVIVVINAAHIIFAIVVTAVPLVVTVIAIALVLEVAHPNVELPFVEVTVTPVVLVPPIQGGTLKHLFNLL